MVDEALKAKIIKDLSKHRTENFIVTDICESTGMKWDEAERLVEEIQANNSLEISSRQKPFLLILGSTLAVGGLILSGFILYETLSGLIIFVGPVPIPYLGNIIFFILGLGLIIGGTRGVIKTLRE